MEYKQTRVVEGNENSPEPWPGTPVEMAVPSPPLADVAGEPAEAISPPPVAPLTAEGTGVRRVAKRRLNPALMEGPDVIVIRRSTLIGGILIAIVFFTLGLLIGRFVLPAPGAGGVGSAIAGPSDAGLADPSFGPPNAKVTIVEFSDFQCPYCKMFKDNTLAQLKQAYGDRVRFVFRDFPLDSIHPYARQAAEAAQCAHEQGKFWEYHDVLFANQQALTIPDLKRYAQQLGLDTRRFNDCVDSHKYQASVEADVQEGNRLHVSGTPTFFINGQALVGAQPFEAFRSAINEVGGGG